MTSNNLFIRRLKILTDGMLVAFDEEFHKGINIIRGDNSSGKSTITHFIFYVLGGFFKDFVPEAKKCSVVFAEVEINGAVITLKRNLQKNIRGEISAKSQLYFFWGNMEESDSPSIEKSWQTFGYNATEDKKSFSNVMFDLLDFPIVKEESNITIHQLLRLIYIDQESPTNSLFYYENFDNQLIRETIAELLLGLYNEQLYDNKKRVQSAEKELKEISQELRITEKFFSDSLMLDPLHVKAKILIKEKEISDLEARIMLIRQEKEIIQYTNDSELEFQKLQVSAIEQREKVVSLKESISLLEQQITDSEFFVKALETKISATRNSIQTREFLGKLSLDFCPECLSKINKTSLQNSCPLCKESIDDTTGIAQARRMEQEISFQILESKKLLLIDSKELLMLRASLNSETNILHQIQRQVNTALNDVKSYKQEILDSLNNQKGFLEGEILQYNNMLESAELYNELLKKKEDLSKEIKHLTNAIKKAEQERKILERRVYAKIQEEALYLLNNDLDRQDDFKHANEFHVDFSNNITFLSSNYSRYSASSNFYLKVTARFAIFLASLSMKEMRFPRFIFADNMEDKGIEMLRAQNLQKILIERVSQICPTNDYQLIYTTSYITDELNNSPYVVGEYYSKQNPSLKNIPKN